MNEAGEVLYAAHTPHTALDGKNGHNISSNCAPVTAGKSYEITDTVLVYCT
ncbi:MAG: hypothetical protein LBP79_02785 [Clostridiales bacterium]|nr:hypothetical protein [Clostridiales bacterium]